MRWIQQSITADNYLNEVNRVVNRVFANGNQNVITPLSLVENDVILAFLVKFVTWDQSELQTQNIMYLLANFNRNISFGASERS